MTLDDITLIVADFEVRQHDGQDFALGGTNGGDVTSDVTAVCVVERDPVADQITKLLTQ